MKTIKLDFKDPSPEEIKIIVDYIKKGETVICPTDTIYGISCDATDKKAVDKTRKIKRRGKKSPFLVLIGSWQMLKKYFFISRRQYDYLKKIWLVPKDKRKLRPTTVLLERKNVFPPIVCAGRNKAAVRLPNNNFLIKILRKANIPLVSTSLNLSGKKILENVKNIKKYFKKNKPDLVVDIGCNQKGRPSRLIDLTDINNIKILRK